jgi:peptidoglycan/xylan/chitin deacetylase (PgdA/CDA1 family)
MYHDVIRAGHVDASGFPGAGPARYKLEWGRFLEHLDLLERIVARGPDVADRAASGRVPPGSWSLTFDDGGVSALEIGEELARRGWRAHFLIPTDFIDKPGFLGRDDITALGRMGHLIGSHSCSHPARMSSCSWAELMDEWRRSTELLSELLGEKVCLASVPGGYYSTTVVRAAAAAGIATLYTSEPVRTASAIDGCVVIGRYAVVRGTPARTAADVAAGRSLPWLRQRASWNVRKGAKTLGGGLYPKARAAVLKRVGSHR